VKRAYDRNFRSFDKGTCERVLHLLEADYLILRDIVAKKIIITKFGVNDGSGNSRGCFGIQVRAGTTQLAYMIMARFGQRGDFV